MWKADLKNTLFSKRMLLVIFSVYAAAWTGCFESVRMGSRDITCLCEELLTLSSFKRLQELDLHWASGTNMCINIGITLFCGRVREDIFLRKF